MAWHYAFAISGIIIPISLLYTYYRYKVTYFERRGIPHIKSTLMNCKQQTRHLIQSAYESYKASTPIVGIFLRSTPAIVILDLDLVKRVLIDDFTSFSDRLGGDLHENDLLHSPDNTKWQAMRKKLTPCFWSAKMAQIFPSVIKAAECLEGKSQSECVTIDLKTLCTRFAANALIYCVFGIEQDDATEPAAALRLRINELLERECERRITDSAKRTLAAVDCMKCTHAQAAPQKYSQLEELVRKARMGRRADKVSSNNILQLIADMLADDEDERSELNQIGYELQAMHLVTRSVGTLLTGFANAALTLMHSLRELAANEEVQRELRQEIVGVMQSYEQQFSYEAMGHMHYLDQVVAETLRKHPATELLMRRTLRAYRVPNSAYIIERGTCVLVPVYAIHHDQNIYPDPEQFDPSRFDADAVMARHACAYLSFDDGPRNCLGKRLSKMLIKVALVTLLRCHKIAPSEEKENPIEVRVDESISGTLVKLQRI
ncbi:probable cytochrome P450 6a13 [Zeugodacus cucurbitae]|uniref:probable cytochrome P450 6a13 n=1 Tax=Zeugodacus cucurbitae TaxID=28588 RepID=UPI0023D956A7|nr:probable cytochrome P450 6a13 [Zeugodacus cucurbitae]